MSRCQLLVVFNKHCTTMNIVKEKQGVPIPKDIKRWPLKALQACVSPSLLMFLHHLQIRYSLNILNMVYLSLRVMGPNRCCILQFRPNKFYVQHHTYLKVGTAEITN